MRGRVFRQGKYLSQIFGLALGERGFWIDARILLLTENQWTFVSAVRRKKLRCW
jgi:hypothetical protein